MLYSRFSLVIYLIHSINNSYMSIPISHFIPPFPPWYPYVCSLPLPSAFPMLIPPAHRTQRPGAHWTFPTHQLSAPAKQFSPRMHSCSYSTPVISHLDIDGGYPVVLPPIWSHQVHLCEADTEYDPVTAWIQTSF